ncbi:MAG: protein kinase [Lentisphaeria bacterium]|nr:protein kinase [Lentisphaeria bacterium]MBQ7396933.1 protein kinase [Lentisphaeria bacterium]
MVGSEFHGLKLLAHCGGGAYGDVYFCEDISGRKMAVKIVSKMRLGDSWERELKGVINYRKITENAPGLLQIFHVEDDDECFFYTMEPADSVSNTEYIPDTLARRLQSGPLPQGELSGILSGVFNVIKLIHDAGFAHRDIKPDNILFVKGVPKLADIGLISALSNSMTQLAGTLDFIPPEERGADSMESSDRISRQRNDLYAFGKVVYCSVTGMGANEYPTVPRDLPLTLPLKYFLRLALRLCCKDPVQRLNSTSELEKEFADIERQLLYGETLRDKLSYGIKQFRLGAKSYRVSTWRITERYWYLMLFLILLGGGAAYWIWKPEKPFDITKQKTKEYTNSEHKISMTVPFHWEIVSKDTFQLIMNENLGDTKNKKFTPKQREVILEATKQGLGAIFCDFDENFADKITFTISPMTQKDMSETSEDELRVMLKGLFEGQLEFKTEIYAAKKITIAGYPGIFLDYSYMPNTRLNVYWIALPNKSISITMAAKEKTFHQRQKEFNSVLTTLKIGK